MYSIWCPKRIVWTAHETPILRREGPLSFFTTTLRTALWTAREWSKTTTTTSTSWSPSQLRSTSRNTPRTSYPWPQCTVSPSSPARANTSRNCRMKITWNRIWCCRRGWAWGSRWCRKGTSGGRGRMMAILLGGIMGLPVRWSEVTWIRLGMPNLEALMQMRVMIVYLRKFLLRRIVKKS